MSKKKIFNVKLITFPCFYTFISVDYIEFLTPLHSSLSMECLNNLESNSKWAPYYSRNDEIFSILTLLGIHSNFASWWNRFSTIFFHYKFCLSSFCNFSALQTIQRHSFINKLKSLMNFLSLEFFYFFFHIVIFLEHII